MRLWHSGFQDVGELGLCRIVLDLGVAGDGIASEKPEEGVEEVDMRSQVGAHISTQPSRVFQTRMHAQESGIEACTQVPKHEILCAPPEGGVQGR